MHMQYYTTEPYDLLHQNKYHAPNMDVQFGAEGPLNNVDGRGSFHPTREEMRCSIESVCVRIEICKGGIPSPICRA
jgi:hypothetical protein